MEKLVKEKVNFYEYAIESLDFTPSPVYFIPHFAGSGTPNLNPNLKGAILNLSYESDSQDILKAILESLCFLVKNNIELTLCLCQPKKQV